MRLVVNEEQATVKLQVAYRRLNEAEHGWNYTQQQLDLARGEVDTRTHVIIHLEHAMEQHATLEQQLLVLQP
jgi:hypothetical protein